MRRILELDAIRGLAAVVIMLYHLHGDLFFFGWAGVDLFFVLSGYLITSIILRKHGAEHFLWNFYVRRSLRIWPIYYLALVLAVAGNPFLPHPRSLAGLPYYLLYLQNIQLYWQGTVPDFPHFFVQTWTLAVEEQFYLLWPGLLLLVGPSRVVPMAVAFIALPIVTRMAGLSPTVLFGRCEGFGYGALLAWLFLSRDWVATSEPMLRRMFFIGAAISMVLAAALCLGLPERANLAGAATWVPALKFTFINGCFACIVGLLVLDAGSPRLAILRDARLVYLGQISYGLYLYHIPVYESLDGLCPRYGLTNGIHIDALKLALTLALASASWRWFEKPILSLKDRFSYDSIENRLPS